MSTIHNLKILPFYFADVSTDVKTFEVRKNDRNFQIGDVIQLNEFDGYVYTGRCVKVLVTYILKEHETLKEGCCILGIRRISQVIAKEEV